MLKFVPLLCLTIQIGLLFGSANAHAAAATNNLLDHGTAKRIVFAGYEWEVEQGYNYPGKNNWLADNVWVDNNGFLHLKITHIGNQWYCAEITSVKCFAYGSYQFQVIGPVDKLDPNIVLGLFVYPGPENSAKENEIDIECTKWGNPDNPAGSYTVTPAKATHHFPVRLEGDYTAHQFIWTPQQMMFQSFYGHVPSDTTQFSGWLYNADQYMGKTAVPPVRVHMNLWLLSGKPPLDGKEQEIIIRTFLYKPI